MMIKQGKMTLREIEKKDLEFLRYMINNPEIAKMTVGDSNYVTKEQQQLWFNNLVNEENKQRFMIDIANDTIGTIILENINYKNKSASISIKIGKINYRKKGYGEMAIKIILKYCFFKLNLHRIYANVLDYNEPSKKLFLKCGFSIEGIKRQSIYKNDDFHDLIMFSILKEEFDINEI